MHQKCYQHCRRNVCYQQVCHYGHWLLCVGCVFLEFCYEDHYDLNHRFQHNYGYSNSYLNQYANDVGFPILVTNWLVGSSRKRQLLNTPRLYNSCICLCLYCRPVISWSVNIRTIGRHENVHERNQNEASYNNTENDNKLQDHS